MQITTELHISIAHTRQMLNQAVIKTPFQKCYPHNGTLCVSN